MRASPPDAEGSDGSVAPGSSCGMRRRCLCCVFALVVPFLTGCVVSANSSSSTDSAVNTPDIQIKKYKKIAVFVENADRSDQIAWEGFIVSALHEAGAEPDTGQHVFDASARGGLSDAQKVDVLRAQKFDGALYVSVVQKAIVETPIQNVYFENSPEGMVLCRRAAIVELCAAPGDFPEFIAETPDGRTVKYVLTLKTSSSLIDISTGRQVWGAESALSEDGKNMARLSYLFRDIAKRISNKMREDHVF